MPRRLAARTTAILLLALLLPIRADVPSGRWTLAWAAAGAADNPTTTSWDLITALDKGAVKLPEGVSRVYRGAHGVTRAGLRLPLPGALSVPIEVPPRALLSLGYAFQAAAFMAETPELAEPGRIQVEITDADGKPHLLVDRHIDLRGNPADRRWFDERLDLSAFAGQKATLTLRVMNEGDAEKAKQTNVYFSAPRILQSPAAEATAAPLNLLFITIDCLRADHVGAYGYDKPTTPNMDRLAAGGIRFAHAYANAPMTLPSVPQLFTSNVFPTKDVDTLLEPVSTAGIPSAAVINNAWIPLWLSQGKHSEPPGTFDVMISGELDAKAIVDRALAWLDTHRDDRFVLYLHFLDAHTPYAPPKDKIALFADPAYGGKIGDTFADADGANAGRYDDADKKKIVALYDAGVRHIDEQIGRLVDALAQSGRLDHTALLVTADHGEEFWDHGHFFHGQSLYDELLHIPLIVRVPGAAPPGTVVQRSVRMIDLAPSLLDWAGLPAPATFQGRKLAEAIQAPDAAGDDLVATATQAQFATRYALRTDDLKAVESLDTGKRELYAVQSDPQERTDLAAARQQDLDRLEQRLVAARQVLRQRGYQVKVAGPQSGHAKVEVRLKSEPRSGTFLTLDRTSDGGEPRLELSTDGNDLTARGEVDAQGMGLRFDRLLSPRNIARNDKLKIEVSVDGKTLPPDAVGLGHDEAPAGDVVDLTEEKVTSASAPTCAPPASGVKVCLWRFPGEKLAAMPEISDPAVREKLRALGYLQGVGGAPGRRSRRSRASLARWRSPSRSSPARSRRPPASATYARSARAATAPATMPPPSSRPTTR
jgi:hypothetical protein